MLCAQHRAPIIPYGAGSSVEGSTLATQGGIAIDMSRMNRIKQLHHEDQDVVVEAGVTRLQLAEALAQSALFFSVDPGADATIGGMASTRASGTNTVRYGTIRENVLALEVLLADGSLIRTGSRARKSSSGYDLTRLFIGAEGTLGLITELTVRLHPRPQAISAAVCSFPTLRAAIETASTLLQEGLRVARVELLDAAAVEAVNRHSSMEHDVAPTLFFEFHGSAATVQERAQEAERCAGRFGGSSFRWSANEKEREQLWHARHNAYYAIRALNEAAIAVSTDICVPISSLADCIDETVEDRERSGLTAPLVGHVGDGNVHFIVLAAGESERAAAAAFHERLVERALRYDGTCSGEHGIGIGKRKFMRAEHGDAVEVMRRLKRELDPQGIFNPGKLLPED